MSEHVYRHRQIPLDMYKAHLMVTKNFLKYLSVLGKTDFQLTSKDFQLSILAIMPVQEYLVSFVDMLYNDEHALQLLNAADKSVKKFGVSVSQIIESLVSTTYIGVNKRIYEQNRRGPQEGV